MTLTQPPISIAAKRESYRQPVGSVTQGLLDRRKSTKPLVEISPQKKSRRASDFKHPDLLSQRPFNLNHPLHSQTLSAKDSPPRMPR
jgi:hypothetical protein